MRAYVLVVTGLLLICPVVSIAIQVLVGGHEEFDVAVVGKWFVFWAVGVRLFMAGLRQMVQPRYTAETILGITAPDATLIVRELGFANAAIGTIGTCSIFFSQWILPMGILGTIFYGLAGINHLAHKPRNALQNAAMISDFFAAAVLLVFCVATTIA